MGLRCPTWFIQRLQDRRRLSQTNFLHSDSQFISTNKHFSCLFVCFWKANIPWQLHPSIQLPAWYKRSLAASVTEADATPSCCLKEKKIQKKSQKKKRKRSHCEPSTLVVKEVERWRCTFVRNKRRTKSSKESLPSVEYPVSASLRTATHGGN